MVELARRVRAGKAFELAQEKKKMENWRSSKNLKELFRKMKHNRGNIKVVETMRNSKSKVESMT